MQFTYQPSQPAVKPASMQNGYASQNMYSQRPSAYTDGNDQGQAMYQALDVQPQVSQKKAKQMPQYEQTQQPPYQQQKSQPAAQKQPAPAQSAGKEGKKGRKSDVEINMIDL